MRIKETCKIDGCIYNARRRGRCKRHYRLWKLENPEPQRQWELENRKAYSVNDYRCLWEARKKKRQLCDEWHRSLAEFAAGVHPKPKGDYKLWRIDTKLPFGPGNFEWRKKTIMLPGETKKEYTARGRREAIARYPTLERDRQLMRSFGLTPEEYDRMFKEQNGVCAICNRPETSLFKGKVKNLAVDHCHESGKNRGLLCLDCNVSIGRMDDSIERLEAAIRYIKKHKQPKLTVVASNS